MEQELLQNKTQEILERLLEPTGVHVKIEFEYSEEEGKPAQLFVKIKSTDDSLLIGYHGNTLRSIQHIVDVILLREFQEKIDLVLDVGDYREERRRKIIEIADSAIEKAHSSKKAIALYPMSAYERKLVHERVSESEDLVSFSEGEGKERRVIISFKDNS